MTNIKRRTRIANSFAVFAYLNIAVQWVFSLVLFAPLLIALSAMWEAAPSDQAAFTNPIQIQGEPNIAGFIFITIVVGLMIALTVYFVAKVPLTIVRASRKVVSEGSDALSRAVLRAQHKKVTKKARMQLGPRMKLTIKTIAVLTPVALAPVSLLVPDVTLDYLVVLFVAAGLGGISMSLVLAQLLAGRLLSVNPRDLW